MAMDLAGLQKPIAVRENGMAQKITVKLEDDLDGGPADETVRFGVGGTAYEIDLSARNATTFRRKLAPFIEHARKSRQAPRGRAARRATSDRNGEIRSWAEGRGIPISARGRIPASV